MLTCSVKKKMEPFTLDITIKVNKGELMVLLGPSGCGKSSLLNVITGILQPDEGFIANGDHLFYDQDINEMIYKRKIGYIQQDSYLFPHMTVKENLYYGIKKKERKDYREKYEKLLATLSIEDKVNQYPYELSGGQQQRVAIGRALMMEPEIFLWDEPFSALDYVIRQDLRELVKTLKKTYDVPMLFVTHDLREAYALGDKIAIMKDGVILQKGKRDEIFKHPNTVQVADIVGMKNIIKAKAIQGTCNCQIKNMVLSTVYEMKQSKSIILGIRPEDIVYVREHNEHRDTTVNDISDTNICKATVLTVQHELDYHVLEVMAYDMNEVLEMILPTYVMEKYHIQEGKSIKLMLKYKCIAVLEE